MYLRSGGLRRGLRRRLGQMLPVSDMVSPVLSTGTIATSGPPPVPADATDCSSWDFFFNSPAWKSCTAAAANAQIANVAANAEYYYGPNSAAAQAAAQAAADQESQTAGDADNIATFYGAGNLN